LTPALFVPVKLAVLRQNNDARCKKQFVMKNVFWMDIPWIFILLYIYLWKNIFSVEKYLLTFICLYVTLFNKMCIKLNN